MTARDDLIIRPIRLDDATSFHACLDAVARERRYLAHALRRGIFRVTLEAWADNAPAIALYEKVGFRHEARTACALRFDGRFHDGVQMALLQGPAARAAGWAP